MREEYVKFETALLAQEIGYVQEKYYPYYNPQGNIIVHTIVRSLAPMYPCPTQGLLQKWIRETHNIHISPFIIGWVDLHIDHHCKVNFVINDMWEYILPTKGKEGLSYEEALEIGLYEALKLIKNEKIKR